MYHFGFTGYSLILRLCTQKKFFGSLVTKIVSQSRQVEQNHLLQQLKPRIQSLHLHAQGSVQSCNKHFALHLPASNAQELFSMSFEKVFNGISPSSFCSSCDDCSLAVMMESRCVNTGELTRPCSH